MNQQLIKEAFEEGFLRALKNDNVEICRDNHILCLAYKEGYEYGSLLDESCSQNFNSYFTEWIANHKCDFRLNTTDSHKQYFYCVICGVEESR